MDASNSTVYAPHPALKETVVFGAAFDPPHWGHALILHTLARRPEIEAVWVTVSPPRWDKRPVASVSLRSAWTAALLARLQSSKKHGHFASLTLRLDEAELQGDGKASRGTCVLLDHLAEKYPEKRFSLAVGADVYPNIASSWRDGATGVFNGKELLLRYPVWVVPREIGDSRELVQPALQHPAPRVLPTLASQHNDFQTCHGFAPAHSCISSSALRLAFSTGDLPACGEFLFPELESMIRDKYV